VKNHPSIFDKGISSAVDRPLATIWQSCVGGCAALWHSRQRDLLLALKIKARWEGFSRRWKGSSKARPTLT